MRTTNELVLYHSLISNIIKENLDDPRIDVPKKSLEIIERELSRREEMAKKFNKMSIKELETFRENIARQREELKGQFIAAGKVKNKKLLKDSPKQIVLPEEEAKSQVVRLKTLILRGKSALLGKE